MVHPMYHQCLRLVNKPLTVHLANGKSYYGAIQNVNQSGVYFLPMSGNRSVSASETTVQAETADNKEQQEIDAKEVFWAPFFFPFGLLAGFTLGFVAGALIPRYPYYPGPYYGPGYW